MTAFIRGIYAGIYKIRAACGYCALAVVIGLFSVEATAVLSVCGQIETADKDEDIDSAPAVWGFHLCPADSGVWRSTALSFG